MSEKLPLNPNKGYVNGL